jgi:hypothetical protein
MPSYLLDADLLVYYFDDREGTSGPSSSSATSAEKALVLALMQMIVQGVSTRRVKKITTEVCGNRFPKSSVSRLTGLLDNQVKAWAEHELPEEMPFLIADAIRLEVRRQGAVRPTTTDGAWHAYLCHHHAPTLDFKHTDHKPVSDVPERVYSFCSICICRRGSLLAVAKHSFKRLFS